MNAATEKKPCISCKRDPATMKAGKSGLPGKDLCASCWALECAERDEEC